MATTVEPTAAPSASPAGAPVGAAPAEGLSPAQLRLAAIGGGILVVIAAGGWFISTAAKRKEAFAGRQLEQAASSFASGQLPLAANQYQRIVDAYAGTHAADEAMLALNQVRMLNGQSAIAADALRKYAATKRGEEGAAANNLLGAALENVAKPADAAQAYLTGADQTSDKALQAELLLNAGRAFVAAGKKDEAIKAYRRILDKLPDEASKVEANVRLAELTKGSL